MKSTKFSSANYFTILCGILISLLSFKGHSQLLPPAPYAYTSIDLGYLTVANDINDLEYVCGGYDLGPGAGRIAFIKRPSGVEFVPSAQQFSGINNLGVAVGVRYDPSTDSLFPVRYDGNQVVDLSLPPNGYPAGINDAGRIVGTINTEMCGFILDADGLHLFAIAPSPQGPIVVRDFLPPLGSRYPTSISGINNLGEIVGTVVISGTGYAFVLGQSGLEILPVDGAATTNGDGINDNGEIVGYYRTKTSAGSYFNGSYFRDSSGRMFEIQVPGSSTTYAYGINNSGQIVGWYGILGDPSIHAFLATRAIRISTITPSPSVLWPPDHNLIDVNLDYTVDDPWDSASNLITTLNVTCNEAVNAPGWGTTTPDWQVVNPHLVRLRAERSGIGNGRVYTITITSKDSSGNSASKNVTVTVPISQGNG